MLSVVLMSYAVPQANAIIALSNMFGAEVTDVASVSSNGQNGASTTLLFDTSFSSASMVYLSLSCISLSSS